jgi:ABC-type glycerol-3-phosphate transport system permease component
MVALTGSPATTESTAPPAGRTPARFRISVLSHGFLVGWAVLTTLPLVWAALSSFKSDTEILTEPWGLPAQIRWENWGRAWDEAHIGRYFLNSAIVVAEGYRGDFSGLFAGMTIAMLPALIGYLAFHRQVQSGLAAGQLR